MLKQKCIFYIPNAFIGFCIVLKRDIQQCVMWYE